MEFKNFRDIDWQLLFIRTYTWLSLMFGVVRTQSVKTVKYLATSFVPEMYCLYKDSDVPVRLMDYSHDVAGSGPVDFYYNRDEKILSRAPQVAHIPRTLNVETASLFHGDVCLYDLTDFFDTTRYSGNQDIPNLRQWLGVWQLENGIYLDRATEFDVSITFLGSEPKRFSLWNDSTAGWNELTSNVPRLHRQPVFRALTSPKCSCVTDCAPCTNAVCLPKCDVTEPASCCDISGSVVTDVSGNRVEQVNENVDAADGEEAEDMDKVD